MLMLGEIFVLIFVWQLNMSCQQYGEKFCQVQVYLYSGDCYQVNFVQCFQVSYVGDEWQVFCQLNIVNCVFFSVFICFDEGVILSLLLECFIQLCQGEIQMWLIKGILLWFDLLLEDVQQVEKLVNLLKDCVENLMIVDLMCNDIGCVVVLGSVWVFELFVVELFLVVYYLVSIIIVCLLMMLYVSDLLCVVFFGGLIIGVLKVWVMEIIDELEFQCCNVWCGSIGYLSYCGNMDISIIICILMVWQGQLYCFVGGGIVVDSEEVVEYQEIFDKVNCILQ